MAVPGPVGAPAPLSTLKPEALDERIGFGPVLAERLPAGVERRA